MAKPIIINGLTNMEIDMLNAYLHPKTKSFKKHELIVHPSDDNNLMGIITSGTAYLATINLDYQKRIIEYYESNDIFWNCILSNLGNNSYYIFAKSKCTVAFIDYGELLEIDHELMINLQNYLLVNYGRRSYEHIDIISQRTLRNKLISFFEYYRSRKKSASFVLPMSLSELADYLAVDRSAMMREIGRMNEEKIIASAGKRITLLQ